MSKFLASLNGKEENIDISVSTGNLKLLTSGIVFSSQGKPISIIFDDVKINFHFETTTKSTNEPKFETNRVDAKELDFILINFNSPFGQGKVEPLNLIFTDHFNIHLCFFVHRLDQDQPNYQLTYSVLYEEKND